MNAGVNLLPARPRNESLSTIAFSPPILLERASRSIKMLLSSLGGISTLLYYSPVCSSLSKRLSEHREPGDKQVTLKHLHGSMMVGYLLAKAAHSTAHLETVLELTVKTAIAIAVIDHHVDKELLPDKRKCLETIESLRTAFKTGRVTEARGQIGLACKLAAEVHDKVCSCSKFKLFCREIDSLANASCRQISSGRRSLADSVYTGARSLGALAVIPMLLDPAVPKRLVKAARHFGAMLQIADDMQDTSQDIRQGFSTFAAQAAGAGGQISDGKIIVSRTFIRHGRKCFECLTVPERDAYRLLWKILRYQWSMFAADASNVNPPLKPELAASSAGIDPFRAVSEHGHYWGPFFIQPRVGKDEKTIMLFKIRTMRAYGRDEENAEIHTGTGKKRYSARVTPIGRFLRKYFLDELPQVVNGLKGQLSVVGLRPVPWGKYKEFPEPVRVKYRTHGPAGIDVMYGFDGKPTTEDPLCQRQRLEYVLRFYEEYEKSKLTTVLKYCLKVFAGLVVYGRRGV